MVMFWSAAYLPGGRCGVNGQGQLGVGDNQNRNKPELLMTDPEIKQVICGGRHTMIWRNNGDVLVCSVPPLEPPRGSDAAVLIMVDN